MIRDDDAQLNKCEALLELTAILSNCLTDVSELTSSCSTFKTQISYGSGYQPKGCDSFGIACILDIYIMI